MCHCFAFHKELERRTEWPQAQWILKPRRQRCSLKRWIHILLLSCSELEVKWGDNANIQEELKKNLIKICKQNGWEARWTVGVRAAVRPVWPSGATTEQLAAGGEGTRDEMNAKWGNFVQEHYLASDSIRLMPYCNSTICNQITATHCVQSSTD